LTDDSFPRRYSSDTLKASFPNHAEESNNSPLQSPLHRSRSPSHHSRSFSYRSPSRHFRSPSRHSRSHQSLSSQHTLLRFNSETQVAEYIADRSSLLNVAVQMAKHKNCQRVFPNDNENDTNKKHDSTCKTLNQEVNAN